MPHPEAGRVPNTPSPAGLRQKEMRGTRYVDPPPHNAVLAHTEYSEAAAAATEVAAEFGDQFGSLGYERVTFLCSVVKGAATTLHLLVQASNLQDQEQADDWYDLWADEAGTGVLARKVYDVALAADAQVAFVVPTVGRYMRVKVWMDGADAASRVTVKAIRHADSS